MCTFSRPLKLVQNVCLNETSHDFEYESVRLKFRSQGQILGKPCICCKGHIFISILMKLGQNVGFDSDMFENGRCRLKSKSQGQILIIVQALEATLSVQYS